MAWLEASDAVNSAVVFKQSVVDGDASYLAFHVKHCLRTTKRRSKTSGLQESLTINEVVYVDKTTAEITGAELDSAEVGDFILTMNTGEPFPVGAGVTLNESQFSDMRQDYKIKQIRLIREIQDFDGSLPVTVFEV